MPVLTFLGDSAPIVTPIELTASNWVTANDVTIYTINNELITGTSNQIILPAISITEEQYNAFTAAKIIDYGQVNGALNLRALGDIPTINIPIRIMFRAL